MKKYKIIILFNTLTKNKNNISYTYIIMIYLIITTSINNKAGIQNKVFTSLEIEQAFVDATVAAMYTVQSKQVQVKRNDKIEYRLVSDLQVKDIKDNPNLDNVNLVIAHLKDVVKIARKDVKLYDGVRKQLKKWADNPMGLIDGIYNQSSDKIKAQIQSQYDELKKLKNDYDTVKSFITDNNFF